MVCPCASEFGQIPATCLLLLLAQFLCIHQTQHSILIILLGFNLCAFRFYCSTSVIVILNFYISTLAVLCGV